MENFSSIFDAFFSWGFVIGAVLLFFVILAVIRSSMAYKNAQIIKGNIIEMSNFAGDYLPTVEYVLAGERKTFKSKTQLEGLEIGKEVGVQVGKSSNVRLFEEGKVDKLPKMIFFVLLLFLFFLIKAISFLNTFFI